jgi:hypothetical protein
MLLGFRRGRARARGKHSREWLASSTRTATRCWFGWRAIEDHTEGFRKSPEYQRWKALLHHFYDSPNAVYPHFS